MLEHEIRCTRRCLRAVRTRAPLNQRFFGDDGDTSTAGEITAKPNAHADNWNYLISILIILSCHPTPTPLPSLPVFLFYLFLFISSLFLHLSHFLSPSIYIIRAHSAGCSIYSHSAAMHRTAPINFICRRSEAFVQPSAIRLKIM